MNVSLSRACPQIFVINLNRRQDRWKWIEGQLKMHKLSKYARFPAVDGQHVDLKACVRAGDLSTIGYERLCLPDKDKIWGMDLTRGALGCALSHFQVWKRIVALSIDYSIVMEDDTELCPRFLTRFASISDNLPQGWDLLFLSGLDTENMCRHMMTSDRLSLVPQMYKTTNMYLITRRGAERMLQQCTNLHFQLDTQMTMCTTKLQNHPLAKGVSISDSNRDIRAVSFPHMYAATPPLAIQKTTLGSDIQFSLPEGFERQEEGRRLNARWHEL